MHSRFIAAAVLLTLASAAWGQAARADSADSDAAMERAKRAAAGPMKAIQQASKIRRRPGEPDAPASPAAPAAPAAGSSTVLAASAAAAPAVVAPVPLPERAAAPAAGRVLEGVVRMPTVAVVAPLASRTSAPATATMPALVVSQPLLEALPVQPKVLSMVEPNIPSRLMDQGPRVAEVEAELSLRADGSVAEVVLVPPVPRAWQRYITTALEQWRFESMAGPRQHRVRLVFGSAN